MKKSSGMRQSSIENVLIKPAGPSCNLACDYCFYLDKEELYPGRTRMELSVAEEMISQLMHSGTPVTFSWQGGEPTLMGLDFFKEMIEIQKKHGRGGQQVTNTIQTNGLLLSEKWADFFSRYNFLVGLSLDGPRDLHDANRRGPEGSGSFARVMEAARLLRSKDVPFNILTVLNSRTVKQPKRILNFFLQNDFTHFQFIPAIELVKTDKGRRVASFSPEPKEFGRFLDEVFSRWSESFPPDFSVRYFESLLNASIGRDPGMCKIDADCGSYLVVEHNGDIYPCDFFVKEERYLGNISEMAFSEIRAGREYSEFAGSKTRLPEECKTCDFLMYCYGGCPRYRGLPGGPGERSYLCEGYRYFLSRNLNELQQITEKVRNGGK